ncbi:unnamed protein product [Litomosoides sigmodontis]|uniref:Uncharacterized protein n=1 Tax=Litomosoides sigmodontis TaxID=42156 RepID=A0A3P6RXA4_LITSI|nr:unnamed protein product [Litomosoides sigmodontis]
MANCQADKKANEDADERVDKGEATQIQLPAKTSLLETSNVTFNIVEITQDSTLFSQKFTSNNSPNEYSIISQPLSKKKYSSAIEASTGAAKSGPFSTIIENMLKRQKESVSLAELDDVLPR